MNKDMWFDAYDYLLSPPMKLRDWISLDKIHWDWLSSNPNAIHLLEANPDEIDWWRLCMNPNAVHILEANPDKIDLEYLSANPNAIHLLEANPDEIDWWRLCMNPNAIHLLEANPDKINWCWLSKNPNAIHLLEANPDKIIWHKLSKNPNAIHLLEDNPDKIDWEELSFNPNAIHLLEANPDKINWCRLSTNPNAIQLLEANPDKINWEFLSGNPNAIQLLEANPDKINWYYLSKNPSIFELDVQRFKRIKNSVYSLICRPTWDDTYMEMCDVFAKRSTCVKLQTSAIIVKDNITLSSGYNGVSSGQMHCKDYWKHTPTPSEHHEWSKNNELHAEMNAILFAGKNGVSINNATIYTIYSPCINCAKAILTSGISQVVYRVKYNDEGIRFLQYRNVNVRCYFKDIHRLH
jgi:dCMP deaminase